MTNKNMLKAYPGWSLIVIKNYLLGRHKVDIWYYTIEHDLIMLIYLMSIVNVYHCIFLGTLLI